MKMKLSHLPSGVKTWNSEESKGYKLRWFEDLYGHDNMVLTEFDWSSANPEHEKVFAAGKITSKGITLERDPIVRSMNSKGAESPTDEQWNLIQKAYDEICHSILKNSVFDNEIDVFENLFFTEIESLGDALENRINRIIPRENEYSEEFEKLYEEQMQALDSVEKGVVVPEKLDGIMYSEHANIVGKIHFDEYNQFEKRAIEHMHYGVLRNKPKLALVKSYLEEGFTQKQIAEKLGKDKSTISRQVSTIRDLEERAEWAVNQ